LHGSILGGFAQQGECQQLSFPDPCEASAKNLLRKTFGAGLWLADRAAGVMVARSILTGQCRRTIFESRSDDERRFVERKAKCVGIRM
jgi:hypothetical protein